MRKLEQACALPKFEVGYGTEFLKKSFYIRALQGHSVSVCVKPTHRNTVSYTHGSRLLWVSIVSFNWIMGL